MFLYIMKDYLLMADVTNAMLSSSASIRKVLVPVDGSSISVKALQYVDSSCRVKG